LYAQTIDGYETSYDVIYDEVKKTIPLYKKLIKEYPENAEYLLYLGSTYGLRARVSLATKKWSKTSHKSLIEHWLTCHKQWSNDKQKLKNCLEFKYEELVANTPEILKKLSEFLNTPISNNLEVVKKDINQKYFDMWYKNRKNIFYSRNIKKAEREFESEINSFGYSFQDTYAN